VSRSSVDIDVAIVGGGVAGSSLAIALARAGIEVALVEREARFRDRVRGDSLFPWGAREATLLGLADLLPLSGARPLPIWQTYAERQPRPAYDWRTDVPTGDVVWGVDHPALQETLFQQAAADGARTLRPAKALAPTRDEQRRLLLPVESPAGSTLICARLVVGADGKDAGSRRWFGARAVRDPIHHLIGGCLVEDVDLDPDAAHLGRLQGGVSLVFRHGSGRARLYLVCQPAMGNTFRGAGAAERFIASCAAAFPDGSLARARAVGPVAFFPGADLFSSRIAGDGIVLIGDAAGANDPSQGLGLSLALRDVRELGALLRSVDWDDAAAEFALRRPSWYEPLRAFATWQGPLFTDTGPAADAARERAARAAELDPWRDGYGALHALGPDGLPVTDVARRHFLGEDLEESQLAGSGLGGHERAAS
jgi:2-polyprenyl-6-methoxyphenol hydroxylase-like FAD-dependent oxidoreductase